MNQLSLTIEIYFLSHKETGSIDGLRRNHTINVNFYFIGPSSDFRVLSIEWTAYYRRYFINVISNKCQ